MTRFDIHDEERIVMWIMKQDTNSEDQLQKKSMINDAAKRSWPLILGRAPGSWLTGWVLSGPIDDLRVAMAFLGARSNPGLCWEGGGWSSKKPSTTTEWGSRTHESLRLRTRSKPVPFLNVTCLVILDFAPPLLRGGREATTTSGSPQQASL